MKSRKYSKNELYNFLNKKAQEFLQESYNTQSVAVEIEGLLEDKNELSKWGKEIKQLQFRQWVHSSEKEEQQDVLEQAYNNKLKTAFENALKQQKGHKHNFYFIENKNKIDEAMKLQEENTPQPKNEPLSPKKEESKTLLSDKEDIGSEHQHPSSPKNKEDKKPEDTVSKLLKEMNTSKDVKKKLELAGRVIMQFEETAKKELKATGKKALLNKITKAKELYGEVKILVEQKDTNLSAGLNNLQKQLKTVQREISEHRTSVKLFGNNNKQPKKQKTTTKMLKGEKPHHKKVHTGGELFVMDSSEDESNRRIIRVNGEIYNAPLKPKKSDKTIFHKKVNNPLKDTVERAINQAVKELQPNGKDLGTKRSDKMFNKHTSRIVKYVKEAVDEAPIKNEDLQRSITEALISSKVFSAVTNTKDKKKKLQVNHAKKSDFIKNLKESTKQLSEKNKKIKQLNEKENINSKEDKDSSHHNSGYETEIRIQNTSYIIQNGSGYTIPKKNTEEHVGIIGKKVGSVGSSVKQEGGFELEEKENVGSDNPTTALFFGSDDLTNKMETDKQFLEKVKENEGDKKLTAATFLPNYINSVKIGYSGNEFEQEREVVEVSKALKDIADFEGCALDSLKENDKSQTFIGALRSVSEVVMKISPLLYDKKALAQCVKSVVDNQDKPWDNQNTMANLANELIKLAQKNNEFIGQYIESDAGKLLNEQRPTTITALNKIIDNKLPEVNELKESLINAFEKGKGTFVKEKQNFIDKHIRNEVDKPVDTAVDQALENITNANPKKYGNRTLSVDQINWLKSEIKTAMVKDHQKNGHILSDEELTKVVEKIIKDSEVIKTPWLTKKPMSLRENKKNAFSTSFAEAYDEAVKEEKENLSVKQKIQENQIPEENRENLKVSGKYTDRNPRQQNSGGWRKSIEGQKNNRSSQKIELI